MDPRDEQREWLKAVLAASGLAATALALRAGLAPATLTRFLNNPNHKTALNARTIKAVETASGMRYGDLSASAGPPPGEDPAAEASPALIDAVRAFAGASNAVRHFVLRSNALDLAGYRAGDIMLVDVSAAPRNGDIVCAETGGWPGAGESPIFRLFDEPFLIAASLDPASRKPLLVDNQKVRIIGPVIGSFRRRRCARAA